jgi:hypothetical protein
MMAIDQDQAAEIGLVQEMSTDLEVEIDQEVETTTSISEITIISISTQGETPW